MTLQRHDDRSQPVTFRGMLRPFGDEQRTQRFGVSRKIVEIGGHIFDVPYPARCAKSSRAPESTCRRLLRRLRRPNLDLPDTRPVEPLNQCRELRRRQAHDTVLDLRPAERPLLEPLGEQA